jgi:hypothetical protein
VKPSLTLVLNNNMLCLSVILPGNICVTQERERERESERGRGRGRENACRSLVRKYFGMTKKMEVYN